MLFKQVLVKAGYPLPAIEDYLDCTAHPSYEGFLEYLKKEESSYNSQVRWDVQQASASCGSLMKPLDGSGVAMLMARLRR